MAKGEGGYWGCFWAHTLEGLDLGGGFSIYILHLFIFAAGELCWQ